MTFEFSTATIYDTVGELIQASTDCRSSRHPKGVKYRILFKLYDYNGNLVNEYSGSIGDWAKLINKDMHLIQTGTIESICFPHPC